MSATSSLQTPRQRRAVLVVMSIALMMVVSAVASLNVALPELARDIGASQSDLVWIVDAYTVVFAGLLLVAGATGDRYGRKRVLLAGLLIFGGAAAGAMFSRDVETLIALRAIMGIGAAAVMPVTLSIITTSFPPEERDQAVGLWVGIAGGGAVVGMFGSGIILEFFSWNAVFGLNVLLAVAAFAGTVGFVPASRNKDAPALDLLGGLLSLISISTIVFGIIEASERGWTDPLALGVIATGIAVLVAFVIWELHVDEPLLDPRLFGLRGFGTGSLSITVQFFAAFGFFFVVLQYLQFVVGYSPLRAAFALLPIPIVMIPASRRVPRIAARFGVNRVGAVGLVLIAAGLVIVSRGDVDLVYWQFALGLAVFAAGMALASTPATTAIVSSLPAAKQGVASAVNDVSRELGSALGIAVLGSMVNSRYRAGLENAVAGLPDEVAQRAQESIVFTQSDIVAKLGPAGTQLVADARQSFVDGTSAALYVAAAVLLLAAIFVYLRAPQQVRSSTISEHQTALSRL